LATGVFSTEEEPVQIRAIHDFSTSKRSEDYNGGGVRERRVLQTLHRVIDDASRQFFRGVQVWRLEPNLR
jgi:hypothetical protein